MMHLTLTEIFFESHLVRDSFALLRVNRLNAYVHSQPISVTECTEPHGANRVANCSAHLHVGVFRITVGVVDQLDTGHES